MDSDMQAFQEGFDDFERGLNRWCDNPHPVGSLEADEWLMGWSHAREELLLQWKWDE